MSLQLSNQENIEIEKLAQLVRRLNTLGHNPATSGNYSYRLITYPEFAFVSESGIDKEYFQNKNFLPIKIATGEIYPLPEFTNRKPSDECEIHLAIYQATKAGCILHSHKIEALLFANLFFNDSAIISGLELLKGLSGITTHEISVEVPLFPNSQNINTLAKDIISRFSTSKTTAYSLILRGHGFYVWGADVQSAKRHLEVFEYIFDYYLKQKLLGV